MTIEKVLNGEIEIEDLEPDLQHRLIELCKERESEVEKKTKKIELEISDHKKNFDFIDQKLGVIPIDNLPDSVTVERSKNKRFFVAIRKTSNALLLSCYRLVFINTFSKVQEISFDFLYWLHDYQEGEESFANEQSAIARSKELICEYDKTHDEKGNVIQ